MITTYNAESADDAEDRIERFLCELSALRVGRRGNDYCFGSRNTSNSPLDPAPLVAIAMCCCPFSS